MACTALELSQAQCGPEECPVVPRKGQGFRAFAQSASLASTVATSLVLALNDVELNARDGAEDTKTSFSDARVLAVADLPLVPEASDEDSSNEGSSDEGSVLQGSDPELWAAAEASAPGRVFAMRELPSLGEILGSDSDDEDISQDEWASDADDEEEWTSNAEDELEHVA